MGHRCDHVHHADWPVHTHTHTHKQGERGGGGGRKIERDRERETEVTWFVLSDKYALVCAQGFGVRTEYLKMLVQHHRSLGLLNCSSAISHHVK